MARIIAISTAAMNALMLSPHLRFRTGLLCGHVDDDAHGWIDERELAAEVRKRHPVQLWITGRYGLRQRVQSAKRQIRGYLGSHGGRNGPLSRVERDDVCEQIGRSTRLNSNH